MEYKIGEESAQEQMDILAGSGVVDIDDIHDKKVKSATKSTLSNLKRAIRKGFLEVSISSEGDLKITQYLQRMPGQTIEYKEITGEAKFIMGRAAEDNEYERMYTLLGYLSGLGMDGIRKLKGVDVSIAESLGAVFLLT